MTADQLAQLLDFMPHVPACGGQLRENAPVLEPGVDHQHRKDETERATHSQRNPVEGDGAVAKQQRVEEEESDRHEGGNAPPPPRTNHRTGWRLAGRTMKGAFAPAPSAASVCDSLNTSAPRYFTT